MSKIAVFCIMLVTAIMFSTTSYASLTKEQSDDIAEFAVNFISLGNERRDERGYPLLVYALSNNWQKCIEMRRSGYKSELYHVYNNNYHKSNGKYLDLGEKWIMDCGDFISYVYHQAFGLDLLNMPQEDPWHIKDMYADANKYQNSQYFEFVYKNVPISSINESKLEKGDIVLYFGPRDNHGLIYVGEGMQTAHASRNGIKYSKNPPILGFEVVTLNRFYKTSTVVSIVRLKDGVVPKEQIVNSQITWPDNGEEAVLTTRLAEIIKAQEEELLRLEQQEDEENIVVESKYIEIKVPVDNGDDGTIYIEKEMVNWLTDGLKKLYAQSEENKEEKA
jgi:hypothetical protein